MQLFSNRNTTTSDLITNTLGAIIGYSLFKLMFKWISKRSNVEESKKTSGGIIANEVALYLVLSFIGAMVFYHPSIARVLSQQGEQLMSNDVFITGDVIEVREDRIRVRIMEITSMQDGGVIAISDADFLHVESVDGNDLTDFFVTIDTQVTIFITTETEMDSQSGTLSDIHFEDLVSIMGDIDEDGQFITIEVQASRFVVE